MDNKQGIPDITFANIKKGKGKERKGGEAYKVKAIWGDRKHAIFVRICLEQMRLGNRPHHTLNKEGYRNLEKEFLKETGLHYNKAQFKNHWDSTRRDWKAWTALRKSTEIVWDEKKNTYSQTPEWWADFAMKYPGGAKFAEQPLTHVEELDVLFGDGVEKGEIMVARNSGNILQEYNARSPDEDLLGENQKSTPLEDNETTSTPTGSTNVPPSPICSAGYSSTPIGLTRFDEPAQAQPLRCHERQPSVPRPEKRAKITASPRWEASLKQMCDILAERTKRLTSSVTEESNPISKAMDLLNEITGIERNSDEWLFTASLLRDQSTRQLFVALGNSDSRTAWIKREYRLAHQ